MGGKKMKIFGTVLTVVYACVMILAVCKAEKKSITSALIAGGSLLILSYSILNLFVTRTVLLFVMGIPGMAAISAGALINGIRQKNLHISHHLIRLLIEGVILVLCAVG